MIEINLIPLVGVEVQGIGQVYFGQSMDEVIKVLGEPSTKGKRFYYDDLEFAVDFKDNAVEFIECLYGPYCKKTKPIIYGKEAFALTAEELVSLLSEKNNGAIDDHEAEYGYYFLEISVGIYRDGTLKGIEECVEEAKREGTYEREKEWLEADLKKYRHFCTIGIGIRDYYRKYQTPTP